MNIYSYEDIDIIREKASILALSLALEPTFNIKVRPGKFYRICDFHYEHNPSLVLYELTSSYHCYGCREAGDIFKYLMEMEKISFPDSVATLARIINLELKEKTNERLDIVDRVLKTMESSQYKELILLSNEKLTLKKESERLEQVKVLKIVPKFVIDNDDRYPF